MGRYGLNRVFLIFFLVRWGNYLGVGNSFIWGSFVYFVVFRFGILGCLGEFSIGVMGGRMVGGVWGD